MKEWPYKRGGLSWGDNLVAFYYFGASKIWHDKRGVLWWEGRLLYLYFKAIYICRLQFY